MDAEREQELRMSINSVSISGNITRDSELRSTHGGMAILSFSVAVNERRKEGDGTWKDYPSYIDCTLFGRRAESLSKYLLKGTKVAVAGKLRQSRWQAQDGTNRSKVEVVVDTLEFMSSRTERADRADDPQDMYGDEIPF